MRWLHKIKKLWKLFYYTGSIQGTKNKVNEFLMKFDEYKWLYKDSIPTKLKSFEKENPTLQEYEEILKHFS